MGVNAETVVGMFSVIPMGVYAAARSMNVDNHLSVTKYSMILAKTLV